MCKFYIFLHKFSRETGFRKLNTRHSLQSATKAGDIDVTKKPSNWRERMMQRQKFWSQSTGFKLGRKLADWGKEEPASLAGGEEGALDLTPEEAELQQAIQLSLRYAGGQPLNLLQKPILFCFCPTQP